MADKESNFKYANNLTSWVRYMLYAQIVIAIIAIGSNSLEYQLLSDYQNDAYTSLERAIADGEVNDQRQLMIARVNAAIVIVSGFLIQIGRAHV